MKPILRSIEDQRAEEYSRRGRVQEHTDLVHASVVE